MAKNLYNVTFSSNFSFEKLTRKFDEVLKDSNFAIISDFAEATAKNITDGNLKKLSQSTIKARQGGRSSFKGHDPSPTTETRPLLYTGRLLNSINATKDGIEMMEYGLQHNRGFTTPEGKQAPVRNFIAGLGGLVGTDKSLDKDAFKSASFELTNNINKAMKK